MVERFPLFHDDRLGRACFCCGTAHTETVDHVPPKVFLDEPYPDDLITVPSCGRCNSAASDDEQYVASLIEVVVSGSTDPNRLSRRKISKTLEHAPALRERLRQASTAKKGEHFVQPEQERVDRVLEKIARGLWCFETAQDTADFMAVVFCEVAPLMDEREIKSFFDSGSGLSGWGETGSRGFIRSCLGDYKSVYGPGWEDVQVGRFSYSADSGGDRVRMIFSNYLYVTVHLEPV